MTRLTFTGDIACDKPLLKAAKKGGIYDFSRVFRTEKVFESSDLVIGNLESCFGEGNYGKKPYHYCVPPSFCDAIEDAGFDIVSTANNHSLDEGEAGLIRTLDILDSKGIAHTGSFRDSQEKRYLIVDKNGLKIAFYALTYSVNPCAEACECEDVFRRLNIIGFKRVIFSKNPVRRYWQTTLRPILTKIKRKIKHGSTIKQYTDVIKENSINKEWIAKIDSHISAARKESDILVILLHIGGQFNTEPGDFSKYMVKHLCGLGADIIAGHHPHTLQKFEKIGKTYVAYSLGGFCLSPSGEYLVKESLPEYSAAWHIDIGEDKKIKSTSVSLLKCTEDPDGYVHVIEAEKESPQIEIIKKRIEIP